MECVRSVHSALMQQPINVTKAVELIKYLKVLIVFVGVDLASIRAMNVLTVQQLLEDSRWMVFVLFAQLISCIMALSVCAVPGSKISMEYALINVEKDN